MHRGTHPPKSPPKGIIAEANMDWCGATRSPRILGRTSSNKVEQNLPEFRSTHYPLIPPMCMGERRLSEIRETSNNKRAQKQTETGGEISSNITQMAKGGYKVYKNI